MDKGFKSTEEALEYLYSLPDYAMYSNDQNEDDDEELEDTISKIFSATACQDPHDHDNNIDLGDIPVIDRKFLC